MTRPLRYDDAFVNILKDKMHDKFLGVINLKVQSTSFCQKFNLQKGLLLTALFDITYGIIFTTFFCKNMHTYRGNTHFLLQGALSVLSIFFGLIGLDCALNLKKSHSAVYKNWRISMTFLFIFIEIANSFKNICFYTSECTSIIRGIYFVLFVIISSYITKISWSFNIRLEQSHELLIIHGKYLEKMLNEEIVKYDASKKYHPPTNMKAAASPKRIFKASEETENRQFSEGGRFSNQLDKGDGFVLFKNEKEVDKEDIRTSIRKSIK